SHFRTGERPGRARPGRCEGARRPAPAKAHGAPPGANARRPAPARTQGAPPRRERTAGRRGAGPGPHRRKFILWYNVMMKGGAAPAPMSTLREFFSTNEIVVVFGYGLVFFLLGFALTLQSRRPSELTVARALRLLGTFGTLHGTAEWGHVFIPFQATYMSAEIIVLLWAVHCTLLAESFTFLMQFGLRLVAEGLPRRYHFPQRVAWFAFAV